MALQGELWRKSQYGVATCLRCGSLGTIVDMGLCCRIVQLLALDSLAEKESRGRLSDTNDSHETKRTRSKAA